MPYCAKAARLEHCSSNDSVPFVLSCADCRLRRGRGAWQRQNENAPRLCCRRYLGICWLLSYLRDCALLVDSVISLLCRRLGKVLVKNRTRENGNDQAVGNEFCFRVREFFEKMCTANLKLCLQPSIDFWSSRYEKGNCRLKVLAVAKKQ